MGVKKTGEAAIRDEAVRAKTGRSWKAWFAVLDRWGAAGFARSGKTAVMVFGLSGPPPDMK